jgi:hypothetical protein
MRVAVCWHTDRVTDRDEFLEWVTSVLHEAELALHNGDAAPRRAIWSRNEDMAYTAGLEHTTTSINGKPGSYTLRATQVYRREGDEWKVAHRHADIVTDDGSDLRIAAALMGKRSKNDPQPSA